MVKFVYTCVNLNYTYKKNAGFSISFGIEEDWDNEIVISSLDSYKKYHDSVEFEVSSEWLDRVCKFLNEQKQLKSLSSWLYKVKNHKTEHQIAIEGEGWNKEINLYNLGEFGNHIHPDYAEDEKVLLEFFSRIQEFLQEVGIYLSFTEVNRYEN